MTTSDFRPESLRVEFGLAMKITTSEYVEVEDMEVADCGKTGIIFDACKNCAIRKVYVHHTKKTGILLRPGCEDILIEDCESAFNDDGKGRKGDADGFACNDRTKNVTVRGCKSHNNSEDGFDFRANGTMVLDSNIAIHNGATGLKTWKGGIITNCLSAYNTTGMGCAKLVRKDDKNADFTYRITNCTISNNKYSSIRGNGDLLIIRNTIIINR